MNVNILLIYLEKNNGSTEKLRTIQAMLKYLIYFLSKEQGKQTNEWIIP